MKKLKSFALLIVFIFSAGNTSAQTNRQKNKMEDAKHGQYLEPGGFKIHPVTVFNQAYSEQNLLDQIDIIRLNIADPTYENFKLIYRDMVYSSNNSGYVTGSYTNKAPSAPSAGASVRLCHLRFLRLKD
jgi:hypothetical protein